MIVDVHASVGVDGQDHPAAAMFDTSEFIRSAVQELGPTAPRVTQLQRAVAALRQRSGHPPDRGEILVADPHGELATIFLWPWEGDSSAIIRVSGPFEWKRATIEAMTRLVIARNLVLYDPQEQSVINNRRSYL